MELIIKKIKTELKSLRREHNLRLKHTNNKYQETLEYTDYYGLNFKKHNLVCKFILQKQEESLSFTYNYTCTKRNCDIVKKFSFMSNDVEEFPCFSETDVKEIRDLYDFETIDNTIKNRVPLETQADVILKVLKNNYKQLTDYVKKQDNNS
jgi:hypothetical protein